MERRSLIAFCFALTLSLAHGADFPYARCEVGDAKTPFEVVNDVAIKDGAYCFKIQKDTCRDSKCCEMNVHKIDIDVYPSCKATTKATATLNGKPKPVNFIVPPNNPGVMTLKVQDLNLDQKNADGAEVCVKLAGECDTLETLCVEGDGTCKVAVTNDNHLCCPVSLVGHRCPVCVAWEIRDPANPAFGLDQEDCDRFKEAVEKQAPIDEVKFECTRTRLSYCGYFNKDKAGSMDPQEATEALYKVMLPYCPVALSNYIFEASITTTDGSGCVDAAKTEGCLPAKVPPFPFCPCVKRPASTPFSLSPVVAVQAGSKPGTKAYCFDVVTAKADNAGKCGLATELKKVEFYVDQGLKWKLANIVVRTKEGTSSRAASWGSNNEDTLKVTNLNWTVEQVNALKPSVCLELKDGTELQDFCVEFPCWASLFDPSQDCCPVYPADFGP